MFIRTSHKCKSSYHDLKGETPKIQTSKEIITRMKRPLKSSL